MLNVSNDWQKASREQFRYQAYLDLTLGITPPGLREGITAASNYSSVSPLSKVVNTVDGIIGQPSSYITLERNWWKLDGSNTEAIDEASETVGWWSEALMSDEAGLIEITVQVYPVGSGVIEGSLFYYRNDTARLEAKPQQGWDFVAWKENNEIISTDPILTWKVTQARSLLAQFEEFIGYNVSVIIDPPGYGTVTGTGLHKINSTVTLTARPANECYFLWWEENGEQYSTDPIISFKITSDRQFIAVFGAAYYNITAEIVPTAVGRVLGTGVYKERSIVTLEAVTTNNDYYFDGWYKNNERISFDTSITFTPTSDVVLQAKWITYEVLNEIIKTDFIGDLGSSVSVTYGTTFDSKAVFFCQIPGNTNSYKVVVVNDSASVMNYFVFEVTIPFNNRIVSTKDYIYIINAEEPEIICINKSFSVTRVSLNTEFFQNTEVSSITKINNTAIVRGDTAVTLFINSSNTFRYETQTINDTGALIPSYNDLYGLEFFTNFVYFWDSSLTANAAVSGFRGNYFYNEGSQQIRPVLSHNNNTYIGYYDNYNTNSYSKNYSQILKWNKYLTLETKIDIPYDAEAVSANRYNHKNIRTGYFSSLGQYKLLAGFSSLYTPYMYNYLVYLDEQDTLHIENRLYLSQHKKDLGAASNNKYAIFAGGNTYNPNISAYGYSNILDFYTIGDYIWATISVQPNNPEMGTTTGAGGYRGGQEVILTAIPELGYSFVNWECEGIVLSDKNPYKFEAAVSRNIIGVFEVTSFIVEVKYSPELAGTVTGSGKYPYGSEVTLEFITNEGYTFLGWKHEDDELIIQNPYTFIVTSNISFIAELEITKCVVTATVSPENFGSVPDSGIYNYGTNLTLVPTYIQNTQATFMGWYSSNVLMSPNLIYSFIVQGDINLVAMFQVECNVTTYVNPSNTGSVIGVGSYPWNSEVTLTFIPAEGYDLENWSVNNSIVSITNPYIFNVTENTHVIANTKEISCTVILSVIPSGSATLTGAGIYTYGDDVTVICIPDEGYEFKGWLYKNNVFTDNPFTFEVQDDVELTALTELKKYTVTLTASPSNFATVSGAGTYDYGTQITVSTTHPSIDANVSFNGWAINEEIVSSQTNYTFIVTENISLVAYYVITCNATGAINPEGAGSISGLHNYNYGDIINIEFTPVHGYEFLNWKIGINTIESNPYEFTIYANTHIIANTNLKEYTVTTELDIEGSGSVYGAGTYNYGSECTINFNAAPGYAFLHYQINDKIYNSNPYIFTVTDNTIVKVFVEKNKYSVTTLVIPENAGTITGGGNFDYGNTTILKFIPSSKFLFSHWLIDNERIETNPYVLTVTKNIIAIANAETKYCEITATINPSDFGTISGTGTYEIGDTVILTTSINTSTNYTFLGWYKGAQQVSTSETYTFIAEEDTNLQAKYEVKCILTGDVFPVDGGSISGLGTYNYKSTATIEFIPATNYTFKQWSNNSTQNPYSFTISQNTEINAIAVPYPIVTVSISPELAGTVTGAGQYAPNTIIQLTTANANPSKYEFEGWFIEDVKISSSSTYNYTVGTSDVSIIAKYKILYYEFTSVTLLENLTAASSSYNKGTGCINDKILIPQYNSMDIYDLKSNVKTTISLPLNLTYTSVVDSNNKTFIIGGYGYNNNVFSTSSKSFYYDSSLTLHYLEDLRSPRYGPAVINRSDNFIIIAGGSQNTSNDYILTIEWYNSSLTHQYDSTDAFKLSVMVNNSAAIEFKDNILLSYSTHFSGYNYVKNYMQILNKNLTTVTRLEATDSESALRGGFPVILDDQILVNGIMQRSTSTSVTVDSYKTYFNKLIDSSYTVLSLNATTTSPKIFGQSVYFNLNNKAYYIGGVAGIPSIQGNSITWNNNICEYSEPDVYKTSNDLDVINGLKRKGFMFALYGNKLLIAGGENYFGQGGYFNYILTRTNASKQAFILNYE